MGTNELSVIDDLVPIAILGYVLVLEETFAAVVMSQLFDKIAVHGLICCLTLCQGS